MAGQATVVHAAQPAAGRRPSDILAIAKQAGRVTQVIDGDTIQVSLEGGQMITVRYIGIDAPALDECNGAQARNANAAYILGQTVRMEADAQDTDAEGRLLRYVYLLNAGMANEYMVQQGYARAVANEPNLKHQGDLNNLEADARNARRGGWRGCGWQSSVVVAPGECPAIAAEVLAQPGPRPGQLNMLHDGDCFTMIKAANPEGPEWSGQYIYHPAGTLIKLTSGYARWKDATVMIEVDQNGAPLAHVVKDTWYRYRPWLPPSPDPVPGSRRVNPMVLERDPGRQEMLQIPNPRTWLFRDAGNGQWEALVDFLEYKSGDIRALYYSADGYLH
jgi:micrococcal nuclease